MLVSHFNVHYTLLCTVECLLLQKFGIVYFDSLYFEKISASIFLLFLFYRKNYILKVSLEVEL